MAGDIQEPLKADSIGVHVDLHESSTAAVSLSNINLEAAKTISEAVQLLIEQIGVGRQDVQVSRGECWGIRIATIQVGNTSLRILPNHQGSGYAVTELPNFRLIMN